jgi:RNA polymerase sigma-70 factor, ECF subfamily
MRTSADDLALVARCKRELPHLHTAFEQLVERYKDTVYTLCYRLVGEASLAEDLMQEVFTKVFLNLPSFEERSAFSSWLYRIAHNHCLNFLAKQKREAAGMVAYVEEQQVRSKTTETQTLSEPLQQVLNQLDEEQRSILVMKYIVELELVEISEILGIRLSAVKMRLLRAREEFRRLYHEQIPLGG